MDTLRTGRRIGTRPALRAAVGVMLTGLSLALPSSAHARLQRLDVVENYWGAVYHRWSYDGGVTWAQWMPVPATACSGTTAYSINGAVSMVSDHIGRLWLAAKTTTGHLVINSLTAPTGVWSGWCGTGTQAGGVAIEGDASWWPPNGFRTGGIYSWNADSYPAITSWGSGRLDLFMHATNSGAIGLLHGWRTRDDEAFKWEVLGTGLMQGSPAAVSWGPGRIDVFARGGGSDLIHRFFDQGQWCPWESLGNQITVSPAVVSTGVQQLSVYVRGSDGALHHRWYGAGWNDWEHLGGTLVDGVAPAPAARDPFNLDVFVLRANSFVFKKSYSFEWGPFTRQYLSYTSAISALYWTAF